LSGEILAGLSELVSISIDDGVANEKRENDFLLKYPAILLID